MLHLTTLPRVESPLDLPWLLIKTISHRNSPLTKQPLLILPYAKKHPLHTLTVIKSPVLFVSIYRIIDVYLTQAQLASCNTHYHATHNGCEGKVQRINVLSYRRFRKYIWLHVKNLGENWMKMTIMQGCTLIKNRRLCNHQA